MSLIDSNSRFAENPTNISNMPRAQFDLSNTVKTTLNVGDLVPFDCIEVLPGDTFNVETSVLARLQTLITPMMDDLYLDMYYFFVPNRLTWSHWKNFCGENTTSKWIPSTTYTIPQVQFTGTSDINTSGYVGSVADYLGIPFPENGNTISVNALPFRAYGLVYNDWFRDQNLQDPDLVPTNDSAVTMDFSTSGYCGKPFKSNKYHDYFTSALPAPQKGPDVTIPMMASSDFPVFTSVAKHSESQQNMSYKTDYVAQAAHFYQGAYHFNGGGDLNVESVVSDHEIPPATKPGNLFPNNLWTNIQGLPVATINDLRLAFATQRLYEKDARGGTRYIEILKSHFGVTSPDARQQRPELLSYNHIPIHIQQIVQNSETSTTPLGTTSAMSCTTNSDGSFIKSFTEHGYILGLATVRYKHSYQQGINRMWSRKDRFDFYWPVFANIGEQPILNKEIYADGSSKDNEVFGYQEAWAEYRYKPDRVSAEMRSNNNRTLDFWHLADDYSTLPFLSKDWIMEDPTNVNRVISVDNTNANQMLIDIYIKNIATRPMPMYSIPGMSDRF